MMKRLYLITFFAAMLFQVHAQNNSMRQIYDQAESEYQIGRLDQAIDLLQTHINSFQGNLKQNAYRLMSLCYLAQDSLSQSENYAMLLLKENPYYTSVQDPIRFEDIIYRLKSGTKATITTASSQAETLDEVPVPVILITQEMIIYLQMLTKVKLSLKCYHRKVISSSRLKHIIPHYSNIPYLYIIRQSQVISLCPFLKGLNII
jgi:iron complex outermembrane receptor protein